MNPADNNKTNTTSTQPSKPSALPAGSSPAIPTSSVDKEHERLQMVLSEVVQETPHEMEIPKEVEMIGVRKIKETVELPPDVKKLGVAPTGPFTPVTTTTALPQVALPISDQNILFGLHAKITTALRWLAIWCIKKLKKAHLALKVIHGKVVRVRMK